MNSANAQVCLEVSFEKSQKKIKHLQPKKKKIHIANEILFFFCLLYSPHHAESAIHNALSTPSGFLRRENTERDVVRERYQLFLSSALLRVRLGLREGKSWMDRLIESRQQLSLGIGSERWTATEEEEKNQLFFFILFVCFFSYLLSCSIDRSID